MRCRRYRYPMPPHLTNQNADFPTKQAYLNLELTPLSLSLWQWYGPPSLSPLGPSLRQAT